MYQFPTTAPKVGLGRKGLGILNAEATTSLPSSAARSAFSAGGVAASVTAGTDELPQIC
jgi:hypothetical protein